ncbi:hypothetical protein ACN27G_06250 [Plantactinospora sp. WMMB334]|uniref:hypothetical protein n=1 Tax=Plantactinospora sp. WMMB334 TaxID=3404119 RepID=UPI003B93CA18
MEFVDRWPVLGRHEMAGLWLRIWVDLGRAPRTIDAAVEDGQNALNSLLLDRLADSPTPAGPTPRTIGIPPTAAQLPIVNITHREATIEDH